VAGVKTHDQHQGDAGKDRYFYNLVRCCHATTQPLPA